MHSSTKPLVPAQAPLVRKMDADLTSTKETSFHCSAEWHLARLRPACLPIYLLAFRITRRPESLAAGHTGNPFFPAAQTVGDYFGINERTVRRSFEELRSIGFLELVRSKRFSTNTYRVLPHTEWASLYPGRCATKMSFPWDGEGDPLGRQLYALSCGQIRPAENVMVGLRRLCPDEKELLLWFSCFLETTSKKVTRRRTLGLTFTTFLKERLEYISSAP